MEHEYLINYGLLGDFGRFRPVSPLECQRGDRVVVRSHRGTEVGEVLCPATEQHVQFMTRTPVGTLLRFATDEDERTRERVRDRSHALFNEARRLADELSLPLDVIDVEVLLDADHAVLHVVRWAECDLREWVSGLSTRSAMSILLEDLTKPNLSSVGEAHGCGSCGSGGCGSGGCSTGGCGSCGAGARAEDVQAYFAALRDKMVKRDRVPLL